MLRLLYLFILSTHTLNSPNYILLDAARMNGEIEKAKELNPEHICLYEGDSERFLGAVAPWLFEFKEDSAFAKWIAEEAHANSWGIFIRSQAEPNDLYQHLRKFLLVATEDGRELYFRYYDPRVLREFLPTCDKAQLISFFGPIEAMMAEDENGLLVEYAMSGDLLQHKPTEKEIDAYFGSLPTVRQSQLSAENNSPVESTSEITKPKDSGHDVDIDNGGEGVDMKEPPKKDAPGWDFGY